ncbi:MAG: site-2 protease family protein [Dehalococcoidia bacterium]|nr:site-2 protease family protein [Dehalococcoidia bacterium]
MSSAWKVGRVLGIPIRIHYTWVIIFVLITVSLVTYVPGSAAYPLVERVFFGVVTSLLFFISITIHELFHSIVAVKSGIPVKDITLFVFGGVSQITREAGRPGTELIMAIMGPVSSYALAGVFFGLTMLMDAGGYELASVFASWLAYINLVLGTFNLIPGFPLDGGRVLRSIIWLVSGNYAKATMVATTVGRVVAYLFIFGGILVLFTQDWFAGLWLAFIGWFLESAASSSQRQAALREALRDYKVRDVMTPECISIGPGVSVSQLVHDYILPTGRRCALVLDQGNLLGVVSLSDIKTASRETWERTRVADIMTPVNKLKWVAPDEPAINLFERMDDYDVNQLPVIENGRVIGLVARDNVIRFLRTKAELGI